MRPGRRGGRRAAWAVMACGTVAAVVLMGSGGTPPRPAWVVVAARDVPTGTLLGDGDLTRAQVPPGTALRGVRADVAAFTGRRTVAPLAPGEPLTPAAVGGDGTIAPLAPGQRAVPVPAAQSGAAAPLAPGARVDVVASRGEGAVGRTAVVVWNAEVLAVVAPDPAAAPGAPTVLLRATPAQALRITSALNFARDVRLVVRPPDEAGTRPPAPIEARP